MRQEHIFIVQSVTYAYRARDVLFRAGIRAAVTRIPHDLRDGGCGYGVRTDAAETDVVRILSQNGIRAKRVI